VLEVSSSPREIEEATSSANALRRRPTATMDEVEWEFYPGTGAEDDVSAMVINSPLVPLWTPEITPLSRPGVHQPPATSRRRKSPKAGAGGGEGKSGGGGMEPPPTTELPARERRLPAHLQDTDAVTPTTPTAKPPHVAGSRGRHGFRSEVRRRLLPALRAFCPDLLMLSAGFDGANRDQGNVKLSDDSYPKGLDLRSEDFGWLTEQLVAVANICCNGRVNQASAQPSPCRARPLIALFAAAGGVRPGGRIRRAADEGQQVGIQPRAVSQQCGRARPRPGRQAQVNTGAGTGHRWYPHQYALAINSQHCLLAGSE
jgi:hypothetical protein